MVFRAPFFQNYELNIVFYEASRLLLFNLPICCVPKMRSLNLPRGLGLGGVAPRCNAERTKHRLGLPASMLPSCCRTWLSRFGLEENVDKRQSGKTKVRLLSYMLLRMLCLANVYEVC